MLVALPVVSTVDSAAWLLVGACVHPTLQVGATHISLCTGLCPALGLCPNPALT